MLSMSMVTNNACRYAVSITMQITRWIQQIVVAENIHVIIILTCNWQCKDINSDLPGGAVFYINSAGIAPIVIVIAYIHHQDVALLDLGCPLRINCSCITRAPRTGPLIAQHSGGWHSYNSAHQNQGGALLHLSSVGVGVNDNYNIRRNKETRHQRDPIAYDGDEQIAPPIVQRQAMAVMNGTSS